jgi:hypothetical protein
MVLLLLAGRLAGQTLTPALETWKKEIEDAGVPVLIARVEHDKGANTYSLPEGVEGRELFAEYLGQIDFLRQFEQMYGVMVHHKKDKPAYLVMLNGGRAAEWGPFEEAVLAHEFGHAWIKSKNYPAPIFQTGLAGCLAIHTGDIAQHVLIRKELERRGIDQRTFWLKTLDEATAKAGAMERPPEHDRCIRVMQAAELVDVRLGLEGVEWAGRDAYETMVRRVFPEVEPTVAGIVAWMKSHDMEDIAQHRQALGVVFEHLKALAYGRSKAYIL